MAITISLPPETEKALEKRAAESGRDVPAYVQELIQKDLQASPTLDSILAPFRRQVEESGMTDDELDVLFEDAHEEVSRESHTRMR